MLNFTAADRVGAIGGYIGGIASLLGLAGGAMGVNCGTGCNGSQMVNRYEMELALSNAAKDSEIALLKADKYTDEKIVEAYKDILGQLNAFKESQNAVNMTQAVYNGTTSSALACVQQTLAAITKVGVPNTALCPGYGNATVTPATTTTTTTPAA